MSKLDELALRFLEGLEKALSFIKDEVRSNLRSLIIPALLAIPASLYWAVKYGLWFFLGIF